MATVVLVIHLMIAAALVAVVLLQRSEGGALGMGGGGTGGGFLTGRGTANLLTRVTAGLAASFFVTSMILTILAQRSAGPASVFEPATRSAPEAPGTQPAPGEAPKTSETDRGGVLDALQKGQGRAPLPTVPQTK
jgi:preprotein translocase subunit SecG